MLQPALPTPTYGELFDRATTAVHDAVALTDTGFTDVLAAHQEILGYQRFLRVSGQHLRLLTGFAPDSKHLRELATRLTSLPLPAPPDGQWKRAAVLLGTAHDLLATHVRGHGSGLTPEASQLLQRRDTGADASRMLALLLEGAAASWSLFHRAVEAQTTTPDPELITNGPLVTLRHITRAIELYGKASLWDLNDTAGRSLLKDLEPATPTAVTMSRDFESSLAALRALRQLAFRQRTGDDRASAASLNDLARLAIVATQLSNACLPRPVTALDQVQHASARDHLARAHATWVNASTGLTTTVRSLTRAASPYGLAIRRLLDDLDTATPAIRGAVLSVLPRLADDTVPTIGRLTTTGALVVAERQPAALSVQWRPLTTAEGDELADRFLTASAATAKAAASVHGLTPRPRRQPTPPSPTRDHSLTQTRQMTP
jgi:hypothetical protein